MENENEKRINERLSGLETKYDNLDDKLDTIDNKHDERHLEMKIELTELRGSSMATAKYTEKMSNSIESLVVELREINSRTDDRFNEVNSEVRSVKEKVQNHEDAREFKLEEKKVSNRMLGIYIVAGAGVLQIILQVIAPILIG